MPRASAVDGSVAATGVRGAQTLDRGLDLLERVTREPMALGDLADRVGLPRRTAARLVHGLIDRGFLTQAGKGALRAGPKLIELGAVAQSRTGLVAAARAPLRALSARTGLSSFLGRRDGDDSVHLHRTGGAQRVIVTTPVGTRRHLAETSLGKALLLDDDRASWARLHATANVAAMAADWTSEMQRAVAAGVVLHEGPPPDCIRAIAMPVRDASGAIVGAISVASVVPYFDPEAMVGMAPDVRDTAEAISRALGWEAPSGQPGSSPEPSF